MIVTEKNSILRHMFEPEIKKIAESLTSVGAAHNITVDLFDPTTFSGVQYFTTGNL
jgi:hypothetical protein